MNSPLLLIWSDSPARSLAIWMILLITVLYLGRTPAHQMIHTIGRSIFRFMRTASRALSGVEKSLIQRNKSVTLALGKAAAEKSIEREFARVNEIVNKDLSRYPALHRQIAHAIEKLENEYHSATDAPPMPPEWLNVVQTISELPQQNDSIVNNLLENIKAEVQEANENTLKVYQKTSGERHKILSQLQPQWRAISSQIDEVKENIQLSQDRADAIDQHMQNYKAMRNEEDTIARTLTASSITQFFIAGLVLVIATLGGIINFQLIAMPMSEMVGGTSYIGALKTSDIAALVIIMIEIAMGLFLLESLRITHLFPTIGSMDDKMRKRMMWISFSILLTLAVIEASLAYMRDLLALDREALQQSLVGVEAGVVEAQFRWIPSIGQMIMGFILPFALAFVAIPLESFIHAVRTLIGVFIVAVLRLLIITLRLIGGFANQLSKVLVSLYDVLVMVPLTIERAVRGGLTKRETSAGRKSAEASPPVLDLEDTVEVDEIVATEALSSDEKATKPKSKRQPRRKSKQEPEIGQGDDFSDLAFQE